MIRIFDSPQFLPIFISYLKTSWNKHNDSIRIPNSSISLRCQVLETNPAFSVSDGFNSIECEFTKIAVDNFFSEFPLMKIKNLSKSIVNIDKYTPIIDYSLTSGIHLKLRIFNFSIIEGPTTRKTLITAVTPLNKRSEIKTYERIIKTQWLRNNVVNMIEPFSNIESIIQIGRAHV